MCMYGGLHTRLLMLVVLWPDWGGEVGRYVQEQQKRERRGSQDPSKKETINIHTHVYT